MKTKVKKQKRWVEKTKKRAIKEIEKVEIAKELKGDLPDPTLYPRAEQPKRMDWRLCKHCEKMNPPVWTDPIMCVHCFHKLDGSERGKK
jgi:uncharacterized paraquat-inducible protein A